MNYRFSAIEERPIWMRLLIGVALGWLAYAITEHFRVEMLLKGSPIFSAAPFFVLGAFVIGGPVTGLPAVALAWYGRLEWGWVPSLAIAIYALEGFWVWRTLRRTRSIVLSVLLFWLIVGGALDYLTYYRLAGLGGGFVVVTFAKQLFNETLCAVLLELLLRVPWVVRRLELTRVPAPLLRLARGRAVLVTMGPVMVTGLVLERMAFNERRAAQHAEHLATADAVNAVVEVSMSARLRDLGLLAQRIEAARWRGDRARVADRVQTFHAEHGEYVGVLVADSTGAGQASSPVRDPMGAPLSKYNLRQTQLFQTARDSMRGAFVPIYRMPFKVVANQPALVLPMAEPLRDEEGRFDGVVAAVLPVDSLRSIVTRAAADDRRITVTLLDQRLRVLVSTDTLLQPSGLDRSAELTPLLSMASRFGGRIEYQPALERTLATKIQIDVRDALFRRDPTTGWYLLVEHPSSLIYERMRTPTLLIVGGIYASLLLLVVVVGVVGQRVSDPLRAVDRTAADVASGRYGTEMALAGMADSEVQEVRDLATRLHGMEVALRENEEAAQAQQRDLERQLLHAQKMEGLGRLAGGVAHDFNNLLTPIIGFADIARSEVPPGSPVAEDLAQIRHAAQRAQEVARHLLAFGRAQVLDMRPLQLDAVVREFLPLLRRTVRENVRVSFEGSSSRRVRGDASQLQQVLMNLGINAADAMPDGGVLAVRVRDAELPPAAPGGAARPGVEIVVSDTGHGMDADVAARAFEPFFTTKPMGKGTGLGLAMVYGIVRQHGGIVEMKSAPGAGTAVHVLLPETPAEAEARPVAPRRSDEHAAAGHETVLVVEDEGSVRALVRVALTRAGYTVLEADSLESALAHAEGGRNIDLLLTDVVMPGVSGPQLADRLQRERPSLRVLFMSGYTNEEVSAHFASLGVPRLVEKPFDVETLTRAVRDALDATD